MKVETKGHASLGRYLLRMHASIPFQRPTVPGLAEVAPYFAKAVEASYFSNGGPCSAQFERRITNYLGVKEAVLCNNATSALMVAARAAFGNPGQFRKCVITPSFSFAATTTAILWAGFEPYFVDVEPDSLHASASEVQLAAEHLGDRCAGMLLGSTFGVAPNPSLRRSWELTAVEFGLRLVVDSAAGFGSRDIHGSLLGRQGDAEIFSFHATKPFAIGEGGVVTTNDEEIAEQCRSLINFGFDSNRVLNSEPGINGKLPEILCAFGLALFDRFDEVLQDRQASACTYIRGLHGFASFQPGLLESAVQFVPIMVDRTRRAEILLRLEAAGVQARTYFNPALHQMPALKHFEKGRLSETEAAAAGCISLPMWNNMDGELIAQVVSALNAAVLV